MKNDENYLISAFSTELIDKYSKNYLPKQVIIPEGDTKKEVYIILSGEVYVTTKILTGYRIIATLGQGEIFGEMAFFEDTPRTATIIAKTDVKAIVLRPENFVEVYRKSPQWTLSIVQFLSQRIGHTLQGIENLYKN
jgi:CRP-like cAMP-binding protein